MPSSGEGNEPAASHPGVFATTHWSAVLAARDGSAAQADEALDELCRTYWYPLYAYVRRGGMIPKTPGT